VSLPVGGGRRPASRLDALVEDRPGQPLQEALEGTPMTLAMVSGFSPSSAAASSLVRPSIPRRTTASRASRCSPSRRSRRGRSGSSGRSSRGYSTDRTGHSTRRGREADPGRWNPRRTTRRGAGRRRLPTRAADEAAPRSPARGAGSRDPGHRLEVDELVEAGLGIRPDRNEPDLGQDLQLRSLSTDSGRVGHSVAASLRSRASLVAPASRSYSASVSSARPR
jgi:hypothetical protein